MSNPSPDLTTAAIKAITTLGGSVDSLVARFEKMAETQTRARKTVRWVIISIVFDVLLSLSTAALGLVVIQADVSSNAAAAVARSNRAVLVTNCNTANLTRLNEIEIWREFLSTPSAVAIHGPVTGDPTFLLIEKTYAPHVCVLLPNGTLPPFKA